MLKKSACLLLGLLFLLSPTSVFAQQGTSTDVTYTYNVTDEDAVAGDILVSTDQGLTRANTVGPTTLFGVIQTVDQPLIVYRPVDETNPEKPVSRTGVAIVNVTNVNGDIKRGDFITSSEIAGKGQKATIAGYVIGVALEDFDDGTDATIDGKSVKSGNIRVALRIEYSDLGKPRTVNRFVDALALPIPFFTRVDDPEAAAKIMRYLSAAFVMMLAFLFGFFTFSRSIPKAIEAIGRNPLAKRTIEFSIILNIILTAITAAIGIAASIIILRI